MIFLAVAELVVIGYSFVKFLCGERDGAYLPTYNEPPLNELPFEYTETPYLKDEIKYPLDESTAFNPNDYD